MKKCIFLVFVLYLYSSRAFSQELDCNITLQNLDQLSSQSRENISDFAEQIKQYFNGQKYTSENYGNFKIHVEVTISFSGQSSQDPHHYVASAVILSVRPINKMQKNTASIRVKDDQWEFDYTKYQQLLHDDYRFDALTSFLDFYAYIVIGYDHDTYNPEGGTAFYSKAMDLFNRARTTPGPPKGWDITSQGAYSRGEFIDDLLNSKYTDYRTAVYRYHYKGLDYLAQRPDKGKKSILSALKMIANLKERVNQKSILFNTFFDTKYQEIAETFKDYPDATILDQLTKIDPGHSEQYRIAIRGQ